MLYSPRMNFCDLQENLRRLLWQRVVAGELTGLQLARQSGLCQAHISNFLNRKRALSLEGMDQVLQSQRLSVLDLLDPKAVNQRSSLPPGGDYRFQNVFLVSAPVAATGWLSKIGVHAFPPSVDLKMPPEAAPA